MKLERDGELSAEIAAIVVAYGNPDSVAAAVDSLIASSHPPIWIAVIEHGAVDALPDRLRARVHHEHDPSNPGFAAGVNRGARAAPAGADLFLLNPDARIGTATLARHREFAQSRPLLAAASVVVEHDPQTLEPWFAGGRVRPWLADIRHARPADESGKCEFVSGASMWIRRAVWDAIGAMDESFFLYCEDVDWCWRARRAGFEIAVDLDAPANARAHHAVSTSVAADDAGRRRKCEYIARGTVRVLAKHAGWRAFVPFGLPRLLWIALRVPYPRSWIKGVASGLRGARR